MGIEQIDGRIRFLTEVEDWMSDQWSTEVFNFSISPYSEDEMEITQILDVILQDIVFGNSGVDEMVSRVKGQPNRLIQGRRPRKKEQHLNNWMGNTFDGMFKHRFDRERKSGSLKQYQSRLHFVPSGAAGPDIVKACRERLDKETVRPLLPFDLGRAPDQAEYTSPSPGTWIRSPKIGRRSAQINPSFIDTDPIMWVMGIGFSFGPPKRSHLTLQWTFQSARYVLTPKDRCTTVSPSVLRPAEGVSHLPSQGR